MRDRFRSAWDAVGCLPAQQHIAGTKSQLNQGTNKKHKITRKCDGFKNMIAPKCALPVPMMYIPSCQTPPTPTTQRTTAVRITVAVSPAARIITQSPLSKHQITQHTGRKRFFLFLHLLLFFAHPPQRPPGGWRQATVFDGSLHAIKTRVPPGELGGEHERSYGRDNAGQILTLPSTKRFRGERVYRCSSHHNDNSRQISTLASTPVESQVGCSSYHTKTIRLVGYGYINYTFLRVRTKNKDRFLASAYFGRVFRTLREVWRPCCPDDKGTSCHHASKRATTLLT